MSKTLETIVYPALAELAETMPELSSLAVSAETILIGEGSSIDSLAVVNLVVAVEQRVFDELERTITLVSERAMSRKHSPFRSLGTLAAYVDELLAEPEENGDG